MRFKLLFAALLALLPVPALADTTAHYSAGDKALVIEVDDGGNTRLSVGDKFAILRRDGVDYILVADASGGFKIAKAAEVIAMVATQVKDSDVAVSTSAQSFFVTAGAEEAVAGYPGMIWLVATKPAAPGKPAGDPVDLVLSADPALMPIGGVFRHLIELAGPAFTTILGDTGNLGPVLTDLFAKGTPTRFGPILKLESLSTAEIGAERFELPGPVLEPMEFLAAVSPSQGGGGMPPLP